MKAKIKNFLVKEMEAHRKADGIIAGEYGKLNGAFKGCSVVLYGQSLRLLIEVG